MLHLNNLYSFRRFAALASLVLTLCIGIASCTQSDAPLPEEYVTLRIKVETGIPQNTSRATAPDSYEPAEGEFETIQTLRIIITKPGSAGTREVVANKLVATSSTGYPTDKLEFKVLGNYRYRIYMIANEDILRSPDSKFATSRAFLDSFEENDILNTTALANWTVAAPAVAPNITGNIFSNYNNAQPGMPLTESFDVDVNIERTASEDDPIFRRDETVDVHLFLTRVACKASFNVNVSQDYKAKGVSITGIRLENIDQSQYVFPRNATYNTGKNVSQLPEMDENGSFKVTDRYITSFDSPQTNTLLNYPINLPADSYVPVQAGAKASFGPYYFPETKFSDATTRFKVSVRLSDSDTWLTARPLTDNILVMQNNIQGIARNTHLVVNIDFDGTDITWKAIVAPYNTVTLEPSFGL